MADRSRSPWTPNLWYNATATDLTAKPVDVEQVFTVNPAILGDQVTISTTKVNKGDTKDITVTVKKANGIERNNAKVELISTVAGMFTAPYGSIYTVSGDGKTATLDASGSINYNIVGGNYVFAGLTFNHKGYHRSQGYRHGLPLYSMDHRRLPGRQQLCLWYPRLSDSRHFDC